MSPPAHAARLVIDIYIWLHLCLLRLDATNARRGSLAAFYCIAAIVLWLWLTLLQSS